MSKPFIEIPNSWGSELINPEDIISIRSNDKSIFIKIENQPEKEVHFPIGKAEALLSQPYFVRCHRCHIVNILKIKHRIKKDSSIRLINDEQIPISDTYKKQFEQTLKEFCVKLGG